jgi:cytochrome o ubiquinol oxidase subunit 3
MFTPHDNDQKTIFGFWVYILTDCMLFATLFATYIVLRNGTYGGPSGRDIFSMPYVLAETLILLTSSYTAGLAVLALNARRTTQIKRWLGATFLLGLAFLSLEINEFMNLASEGHDWQASAFLSAFFTLVGTHGLHITAGLLWLGVLLFQLTKRGLTAGVARRLRLFSLFWHFLDIVWIFIFTIVFMMGAQ